MENKNAIIDFEGSISFETMEKLLNQLKSASQFNALRKPVRKRVYGTVVESIDNIFKYATPFKNKGKLQNKHPHERARMRLKIESKGFCLEKIVSDTSRYG